MAKPARSGDDRPRTRELVENIYIRKVVKEDGVLFNKESTPSMLRKSLGTRRRRNNARGENGIWNF